MRDIRNKDVMGSLPLVASILGRSYGVRVEIGGSKAYTDGRTIHLPAMPLDADGLIPVVRGFLDHEAAHIRESDFGVVKGLDPLTKRIANTIEDWRVEERLAAIFPGCRENLRGLVRRMLAPEDAVDLTIAPAMLVPGYILAAVRAWAVPEVGRNRDRIAGVIDTSFPGLRREIDSVLDDVAADTPDTAAAVAHARHIVDILRGWNASHQDALSKMSQVPAPGRERHEDEGGGTGTPPPKEGETGNGDSDNGNGSAKENDGPAQEDGSQGGASADEQDNAPSEEGGGNEGGDGNGHEEGTDSGGDEPEFGPEGAADAGVPAAHVGEGGDDAAEELKALLGAGEDELPQDMGGRLAAMLEEAAQDGDGDSVFSIAVEAATKMPPMPVTEITAALRASTALRHRLQGLLQASIRRRVAVGRRGRLDTGRLHRLWVGDGRVFRKEDERQGLNTAVHILLDASASMGERMALARQACYAVARGLHGIPGVSVGVTAFSGAIVGRDYADAVMPILRHGARLGTFGSPVADGGTPLAQAVWWALREMLPLRESRKLLVILTDGAPDSDAATVRALADAERAGVEAYGVGIMSGAIRRFLPRTSREISALEELSPAMFDMLRGALIPEEDA